MTSGLVCSNSSEFGGLALVARWACRRKKLRVRRPLRLDRGVLQAMAAISESSEADRNAQRLKEKELASVTINPEDVDLIATELEMDRKQAERTLREHKGDAVSAVRSMLQ
eukprot:SM000222S07002  [mRNA]  locus=s222:221543:222260:- [translate_table: standard]